MKRHFICGAIWFAFITPGFGQAWSGILDPTRAVDWSMAGIAGGIPNITTQCGPTLNPSGGDDTAAIQAALNNSCAGEFVQLALGTFLTNGTFNIPTGVVLRGMGADKTIIQANSTAATVNAYAITLGYAKGAAPSQLYSHTLSISSSNSKGDTSITVTNASPGLVSAMATGDLVWIASLNDWDSSCPALNTSPTSHCINTWSTQNSNPGGSSAFNMDGASQGFSQRASGQLERITAIAGNTLTLADPLVDSFRHALPDWVASSPLNPSTGYTQGMAIHPSAQPSHVYYLITNTTGNGSTTGPCVTGATAPSFPMATVAPWPTVVDGGCTWQDAGPGTDSSPRLMYYHPPALKAGLENLQIFGVANLAWGNFQSLIQFNVCDSCWVRGVEINRPIGFIITTNFSLHGQIEQNYFTNSWYHGSGTDSVVDLDGGTSAFLVQNNIFERTPEMAFTDNGGSGNVIAYNYIVGNWGANSTNSMTNTVLSHDAHPWFDLIEGNILSSIGQDDIHGGNSLGTFYRNWLQGTTTICTPVAALGITSGNPNRPPAGTVTTNAVGGATSYGYSIEAVVGGATSPSSTQTEISNGPATLSSTVYNTITAPLITAAQTPSSIGTDSCLIFRSDTPGPLTTGLIGSIPCDGASTIRDTGQTPSGLGMLGGGTTFVPNAPVVCSPVGNQNSSTGLPGSTVNGWLAFQGNWPLYWGIFSSNFNVVGNATGSGSLSTVGTNQGQFETRKACSICSTACVQTPGATGGTASAAGATLCGANSRNFSWLIDENSGYGGGVPDHGANASGFDTTLAQDTMFHCKNYYHSNNTVETGDCSSGTTLPASFYLSAKPSWWGTGPYPATGSDVTGGLTESYNYSYNNPAKNCYENVMHGTDSSGGPFTFNANACYAQVTPPPTTIGTVTGTGVLQGQGVVQ